MCKYTHRYRFAKVKGKIWKTNISLGLATPDLNVYGTVNGTVRFERKLKYPCMGGDIPGGGYKLPYSIQVGEKHKRVNWNVKLLL